MVKQFLKYQEFLNEALKLSQYRQYHDIRPEDLEKQLSEIFKGKNRIYIPFESDIKKIKPDKLVDYVLKDNGYKITNYLEGYCEKDGRTFRIGKVLNQLKEDEILDIFKKDPYRNIKEGNFLICISKHPYDIAGMSTDRGWTSCMEIGEGYYKKYMSREIKEGTVIAYLINRNDMNINHPYGRVTIKPYINEKTQKIGWGASYSCYGSVLRDENDGLKNKFLETVNSWIKTNMNKGKYGLFTLSGGIYRNEAPLDFTLGKSGNEWFIDSYRINSKGLYYGDIEVPKEIKNFVSFEEEINLYIQEIEGNLSFKGCTLLESIIDLPYKIFGNVSFVDCVSLKSIDIMPSTVSGSIDTKDCPFFEGMTEEQIRKKYNISK